MKKETEDQEFIDVAIGKIRIRLPDTQEDIKKAKIYIDTLYDLSNYTIPKFDKQLEQPEVITQDEPSDLDELFGEGFGKEEAFDEGLTDEIRTEIIEPISRPSYKKLPVVEEQAEVKIEPSDESYSVCPLCAGKLKKQKVKQTGNEVRQVVLCKNKKCKFQREYVFSI